MKKEVEKLTRLVVGSYSQFAQYSRLFPANPAHRLIPVTSAMALKGLTPDQIELVVLPMIGSKTGPNAELLDAVEEYARRWSGIGIDYVTEDEMRYGAPARQARLMEIHDKMASEVGWSRLSQAAARGWLRRLRPQDVKLVLEIQEFRRKQRLEMP